MKIFADDFQEIGFYISHKDEALAELAESNKVNFDNSISLCDGTTKRNKTKPIHPDESEENLPDEIRGSHFDGFKELCKCLNCYRQR